MLEKAGEMVRRLAVGSLTAGNRAAGASGGRAGASVGWIKRKTDVTSEVPGCQVGKEREDEGSSRSVCFGCQEEGHYVAFCPEGRGCFRCGERSHLVRECKKERKEEGGLEVKRFACALCKIPGRVMPLRSVGN